MKRCLFALILFAFYNTTALAADVKISWDPMLAGEAWQAVRVYERIGAPPDYTFIKVAEVAGSVNLATVANVIPGAHTYVIRSFNGTWESADSAAVVTPQIPAIPTGVKYTITITITP
jgi:hypothetical protein